MSLVQLYVPIDVAHSVSDTVDVIAMLTWILNNASYHRP